jgi:hypothetical protein
MSDDGFGGFEGILVAPSLNTIGANGSRPLSMGSPAQATRVKAKKRQKRVRLHL